MTNGEWLLNQTDVLINNECEEGWLEITINKDWWDKEMTEKIFRKNEDNTWEEVAELIRCKNCKYYNNIGYCFKFDGNREWRKPNHYCSYGDKKCN